MTLFNVDGKVTRFFLADEERDLVTAEELKDKLSDFNSDSRVDIFSRETNIHRAKFVGRVVRTVEAELGRVTPGTPSLNSKTAKNRSMPTGTAGTAN